MLVHNDSLPHPQLLSITSSLPSYMLCFFSRPSCFIFIALCLTTMVLVFPLFIVILCHGLQEWRKKLSNFSAAKISHIDCFTYHMVIMELIGVPACVLLCYGVYREEVSIFLRGMFCFPFIWYGDIFFHILSCLERYLAVVHPVTYLSLKNQRGVRIRNVSIGCVWLLCSLGAGLVTFRDVFNIIDVCILLFSLTVVSFCSLSVLCVLIRPGPGDQGSHRKKVDRSKQKAFCTILTILGVLVVRFTWGLVRVALHVTGGANNCVLIVSGFWFSLPNSLVLPLLFLQRAGKFLCFRTNNQ